MSLPKLIYLTLLNWLKWNPRKDLKSTSWLRLQNTLFEDPQFFDFDHSELLFFVYLLCQASKKQSGEITVNVTHAVRVGRFQKETIDSSIKKLQEIQCVRVRHVDETELNVDVPLRNERNVTERNVTERNVTNDSQEAAKAPSNVEPSLGSLIWDSYSQEFKKRYGVSPVRNAKSNSQCKQLGTRLGKDAIAVVAFYLTHNDGWYLKRQHDLGSLVQAAESLYTQWQRGQAVTGAQVRSFEKQSNNMDLMGKLERGEV